MSLTQLYFWRHWFKQKKERKHDKRCAQCGKQLAHEIRQAVAKYEREIR